MSSQDDLFATQVSVFATQEQKKKTKYDFLVLCDKDEDSTTPFSLYPTSRSQKPRFKRDGLNLSWMTHLDLRPLTLLEDSKKKISVYLVKSMKVKVTTFIDRGTNFSTVTARHFYKSSDNFFSLLKFY